MEFKILRSGLGKIIVKIKLEAISVYTIRGKRHLYKLADKAYGEWLIYKNDLPVYYFNIFDDVYKNLDESVKRQPYNYLQEKFKQQNDGLTLSQGIYGIWSSKINDKWFDLDKLPVSFFE